MKHSLVGSLLTLASVVFQASAVSVDPVSGKPITSSSYYQYHTQYITTTCYRTVTKEGECKYGGDYPPNTVYETIYGGYPKDYSGGSPKSAYETIDPQFFPGPDYNDYKTVYETVYETAYPYPITSACYPQTVYETVYFEGIGIVPPFTLGGVYHTVTENGGEVTVTESDQITITATPVYHSFTQTESDFITVTTVIDNGGGVPMHGWALASQLRFRICMG